MNKGSSFLSLSDKERDDLLKRNRIAMQEQRKRWVKSWSCAKLFCTDCGAKLEKPQSLCWVALCNKCKAFNDKCERAYGGNSDHERLISK